MKETSMLQERKTVTVPGIPVLVAVVLAFPASIGLFAVLAVSGHAPWLLMPMVLFVLTIFVAIGLFTVSPNHAAVLTLFGRYVGTVREAGMHWTNPFYLKRNVSVRVRNFESSRLKVNDHDGNPIEIAAIVVWRVVDTAQAVFDVDDYTNYVQVQSEAAVRALATHYPYDAHQEGQLSLRANVAEVSDQLKHEIQQRLDRAGCEVLEARLSHLAYAPEIAQVMLRRQQASAIIAARTRIVEGAVSMVEMALDMLTQHKTVQLDEDRKAAMVSNLLVVLCGEREATPVVNTGTIYQ
jgi:regulator of protease activity HflC (stomatin/prohibitin superfamily)